MSDEEKLNDLLKRVRGCQLCAKQLPNSPRPVIRAHSNSRLLIIGQAPGAKVHASGIPWDDPSGDRLRVWLNLSKEIFYDEQQIAIIPMGFCFPGKGRSGDLPPRPECAPSWHKELLICMPNIQLTLLVGQYAQRYYLARSYSSLTSTVKQWRRHLPQYFALPHPSPRNNIWLRNNLWFEADVLPELRRRVDACVNK